MPWSRSRARDLFECSICHKLFKQEWVNNHNCQRSVQRVAPLDKDGLSPPKERHSSPERHSSRRDRQSSQNRLFSPKDRHGSQHIHSPDDRHFSKDRHTSQDRHFSPTDRRSSQDRHSSPTDRHSSQDRQTSPSPGSITAEKRTRRGAQFEEHNQTSPVCSLRPPSSHYQRQTEKMTSPPFPIVTYHPSMKTTTATELTGPSNNQLPQYQRVKLLTNVKNSPQSASSDRKNQCPPLPEAIYHPSMQTETAADQWGSFNSQLPPNQRMKSPTEVKSSPQSASFDCINEHVQSQTEKVTSPPLPNVTYHHSIKTKTADELAQLRQNQRVRSLTEMKHSLQATSSDCKNQRVRSPTEVKNSACSDCNNRVKSPSEVKNSPQSVTSPADDWGRLKTRTARAPVIRQSASIGEDEDEDGDDEYVDSHPTKPLQEEYGYLPDLDTASLARKAEEVIRAARIDQSCRRPETLLKEFVKKDVKLPPTDWSVLPHATQGFKTRLLERLNEETDWEWARLDSGSYYDGTKVTRADELDIMFYPKISDTWLEIDCRGAPEEYCFLKLKRGTLKMEASREYIELKRMCCDPKRPDLISSQVFREKIHGVFQRAVDDERRAKVCNGDPGSPSFCVKLWAIPSSDGTGLKPIDIDLVPSVKLRRWPEKSTMEKVADEDLKKRVKSEGFAVIPKEYKKGKTVEYMQDEHEKRLLWRYSFSKAEKELTRRSPEGCWRTVLRVLKRSLELMKGFENQRSDTNPPEAKLKLVKAATILRADFERIYPGFAEREFKFKTFQVRTLMWTELYTLTPEASLWEDRKRCLSQSLTQLLKMLSGRMHVPHFFVPDLDIMAGVPREEREFLYIMFLVVMRLFCGPA